MSLPSKSTRPVSGISKPPMIRNIVVLPQPEGPSNVINSLSYIVKSISSSTNKFPNDLATFSKCISSLFISQQPFIQLGIRNEE